MVSDKNETFPSVYPYVDFVDKKFVYNTNTRLYESPSNARRDAIEPEIWHGVINPAAGRAWN
jgi:hypothetical protein